MCYLKVINVRLTDGLTEYMNQYSVSTIPITVPT